jgi:outer membrane protein insertion porin family
MGQDIVEIKKISFSGNSFFHSAILRMETSLYTINWFEKKILGKQPYFFSRSAVRMETDKLRTFYQREGFLYATVNSKIEGDGKENSVKVELIIDEGEPVVIQSVNYGFESDSPDKMELKQKFEKEVRYIAGQRFRDEEIHAAKQAILKICYNAGYPYATVSPDIKFCDNTKQEIELRWKINTGLKSEFASIEVIGNEKIETSLILNQLAFEKGMQYSLKRLDKSQEWIYELGVFQVASIRPLVSNISRDTIFVQIVIKEAPRISLKTGVGYGSEDKLRLMAEIRKLGFLGGARRLTLYARHSALEPYHLNATFVQPAFFYPTLSLQFNPFIRRQEEPGYSIERKGSSVTLTNKLVRDLYSYLRYTYEIVDNLTDEKVAPTSEMSQSHYNKDNITLGLTYDNGLPKFTPRRGFYYSGYYMVSGIMPSTTYKFRKWLMDFRKYQSIRKSVFAFRIKTGFIQSHDSDGIIPSEERFYAGGSNSIRGWQRSQLGPLDGNGKPLGGNVLFESSLEWRYSLVRKLSGVVFIDAGNVWQHSFKFSELRFAMGAGMRYDTPIGPIRIDLAIPVFDEKTSTEWHFSIGHAF